MSPEDPRDMASSAGASGGLGDKDLGRLQQALEEMRNVLGADHVFDGEDEVRQRAAVILPTSHQPSAFVYPANRDEVVALVEIGNRHRVPLWPTSKGKNWGYGSATPAQPGAVVVVLERMNRIITVNEELAFAVVEPGVTYRQLHAYLEAQGLPLWIDCTDGPAEGSVIGNALERGIGETPYGDHFGNLCGIEAVMPDGSLVQTGGGPMDRYPSWNTYKWGVGPYLEGLFSQSNYGIVTKSGIWLMPRPERFLSCFFELGREADFPAMIDAMRRLQFNGALSSKVHIINDNISFAIAAEHPRELLQGAPYLSDERRAELRRHYNVAPWLFAGGVYGTRRQVRANVALIKRELAKLGTLQFVDEMKVSAVHYLLALARSSSPLRRRTAEFLARWLIRKPLPFVEQVPHLHAIEQGFPSDHFVKHAYFKCRTKKPADDDIDPARDSCGLIWIGPMVPLTGIEVSSILELCKPLYRKHQLDLTAALMVANPRTMIVLMSIFYDRADPDESERAKQLYFELGQTTQAAGYQQYRTSTIYMDQILDPAPEFRQLANRIKEVLDPNGILAPGKYGIGG